MICSQILITIYSKISKIGEFLKQKFDFFLDNLSKFTVLTTITKNDIYYEFNTTKLDGKEQYFF